MDLRDKIDSPDWKTGFIVTFLCLLLLLSLQLVDIYKGNKTSVEVVKSNYSCSPCNYISGTPSWLLNGKLIGSGYQENITTQLMIDNNVTFIYRDGCGWCDKQKENLDMDKLNELGLAIKC